MFKRGDFNNYKKEAKFVNLALEESRNLSFKSSAIYRPKVFLSHKHSDLEDLKGVMGAFEELGAKIYIDSMDNKMPNETSGETAERIKDVIKTCKKFVLLATKDAIQSYWCNWELGIGDTHKFKDHIAILPMKENGEYDNQYIGNEYLQIYPSIEYRDGTGTYRNGKTIIKGFYVKEPMKNGGITITPLNDWLNS
jgi:hypothetical protein|tara:strand:- start:631 stop:1215 length:585 start_codon:yes stop_codon:yes gene_type:complete